MPADALKIEKTHVKPGGEHVFHLHIQRLKPPVGLQVRQHVGAQIHQETDAIGEGADALQQPPSGRHRGTAVMHFGGSFIGGADLGGERGLRALRGRRVGNKLLAHQQPHVVPLGSRGTGIPANQALCPAAALHFADLRVHNRLQFIQQAAQNAG